mgnify:FL=1
MEDEKSLLIVDRYGDQIIEWTLDTSTGSLAAGGNGKGKQMNQFDEPSDVRVDKRTNTLIICDSMNRRVMQWPRRDGTNGEILIDRIPCAGLAMDEHGFLYISNYEMNNVKRYRIGDSEGTVVAGNHGKGDNTNQLDNPTYIFIDKNYSIYISDTVNNRIMKWMPDAREGIVVAGSDRKSHLSRKLYAPHGLFVDQSETVYIADWRNQRIVRWNNQESIHDDVIIDRTTIEDDSNERFSPPSLTFDRHGNLYVVDGGNCRIQRFPFEWNQS